MKKLLIAAVFGGLVVAALTAAGPPVAKKAAPAVDATALAADIDDVQDVLYLGHPHPALVRLHLRVDNKSTFARWDGFMESMFQFLDRNKSGNLDRAEANRAPVGGQINSFYVGNPFAFNPRGRPVVAGGAFADMDANRDGKVTLDELKEYYRKNNAGPINLAAAAVAGTMPLAPRTAGSDPLFELLDTNKDGKLSKRELGVALATLTKYDVNDDELVSLAELNMGVVGSPFARLAAAEELLAAQIAGGRPAPQPQATNLMLIPRDGGKRAAGRLEVARELIKRFDKDKDGALNQDEIGLPKDQFDAVKRKRDAKMGPLEVRRWLERKPVADLTVKITGGGAMMRRPPARGQAGAKPNTDDTSVALDGVRIKVVSAGAAARYSYKQYLTNVFKQIDDEKRGFITRKDLDDQQYAFMRGLFDFADRNADNRLTEAELKGLLDVMEAGQGAQLTFTLAANGQGLFQVLDSNADGNLSVRELRDAWARVAGMDKNKDGALSRTEFPQQYLLNVSQGPSAGFIPPDAFTDPYAGSRASGPLWFRKMDRNGDGDISRLEWLGDKDSFNEADSDKDDLISAAEAEAYDAKLRKK